ncbi:MAG TPA: DUF488 family protein, partial [Thermoanaerobaculia bacterium]|nr:DUF488 family protein [Thermoanaerobaculia bacterium]
MRFLPRGVRAEDYARQDYFDVWLPTVAPEAELISWLRREESTDARWKRFAARYAAFLRKNTDARQVLELLALLAG